MIAASLNDERAVRARERALAKARKTLAKRRRARERRLEHDRNQFRAWITREREAWTAHNAEPSSMHLRRVWLKVLAERPPLYGKKES